MVKLKSATPVIENPQKLISFETQTTHIRYSSFYENIKINDKHDSSNPYYKNKKNHVTKKNVIKQVLSRKMQKKLT